MYHLPKTPTHLDAIELWPIIVPTIERLEMIASEIGFLGYHELASVTYRFAYYLAESIIDAELGILGEVPECQAKKHACKCAMKVNRREILV
ncbi:MAG: hypothetical protein ACON4C_02260 [Henriciella sp.]